MGDKIFSEEQIKRLNEQQKSGHAQRERRPVLAHMDLK